jgi:hypothetical protein
MNMKKSVLIISAISALVLVACSGNQKPKSNGETNAQNADTVAMGTSAEPSENEELVEEEEDELAGVPDDFIYFVNKLPQSPEKTFYHKSDKEKCGEYCSIDEDFYAYPMKKGGYLTVFECVQVEEGGFYGWYGAFSFVDGELHRANGALPVPKLDDWIDQSKCEGREKDVEALKEEYSKGNFEYEIDKSSGTITPTVKEYEFADNFYADLLKKIDFTWDGEKFVPKEVTDGIAMRFWRRILQGYDPIGRLEGDEVPSAEMIAGNLKRIKEESGNVAVYVAEGVEGFTETAACYPKTDGSWFVLFYLASSNNPDHRLTVYDFDGSNITRRDNYFPDDFLKDGRYLTSNSFGVDELSVVRDTDAEEEVVWYKWNGEDFVKQ